MDYIYLAPTVVSRTTESQFRMVGLQNEAGVHVTPWLDAYLGHESLHLLDREHSFMERFPVADWIGIRFNLFTTTRPIHTLLP